MLDGSGEIIILLNRGQGEFHPIFELTAACSAVDGMVQSSFLLSPAVASINYVSVGASIVDFRQVP